VREQLRAKTHWEESSDLAMMFQGTYTSEFYRTIRDLLHDQVSIDTRLAGRTREHETANIALRQRWDRLLADEARHRSEGADLPWRWPTLATSIS
jgi:anaerobic magnesium-protoporphyrin IX monomethyl ester cyclase